VIPTSSEDKSKVGSENKKEKKKTKKEKKETNGLKKPLSAYMLFNNSKRPQIKQEYPSKYLIPPYFQNLTILVCFPF
jgi:hypothetical protein